MSEILSDLYQVLLMRKNAPADESYVASLYAGGVEKMAEKILEEAAEFIAEARTGDLADNVAGSQERLREEAADLLFHILVLMADQGLDPADVLKVLERRFGTSGHAEKASRCS